jgi:hypothetical protein
VVKIPEEWIEKTEERRAVLTNKSLAEFFVVVTGMVEWWRYGNSSILQLIS